MEDQQNRAHRPSKGKQTKGKKPANERNPKAFSFANPGRLAKSAARSHDIKEKRFHVPQVDRLPEDPPPRLVTIVGPPGVGKTTLLKSLVKRYTKETLSEPQGPITVVTSKRQRLTFVECPNELAAMVDLAKIADVILLLIDGNFGFEMETMEFLNVLSASGMPGNVFGILTHLDLFRKPQTLRDAKKRLKSRFWSELYQGAHLFYLSGVINGRYPDREIHNISRFLSVMKNPRPLIWRNTHPYAIIDSFRDTTHPSKIEADAACDRTVVLSGYLRGINFAAQGQRVHIPGLGDFTIAEMESLPDPCPSPHREQALAKASGRTGRRRLDEKEKKLHAPMSDRSGLKIDGDTIWITRQKGFDFDKDNTEQGRGEGEELIIGLQGEQKLLGETAEGVRLFTDGEMVHTAGDNDTGRKEARSARYVQRDESDEEDGDVPVDEGFVSDEDGDVPVDVDFNTVKMGKSFRPARDERAGSITFADSDSDMGSLSGDDEDQDEDGLIDADELRWKEQLAANAGRFAQQTRSYRTADLARLMYDESLTASEVLIRWRGEVDAAEEDEELGEDEEDEFFRKVDGGKTEAAGVKNATAVDYAMLETKWSDSDNIEALRQRFATYGVKRSTVADDDDMPDDLDDDDEGDGVFEDLEAADDVKPAEDTLEAERAKNAQRKEELKQRFEHEDREGFLNDKAMAQREQGPRDEFGEDEWYDAQKAQIQKQLDINKTEMSNLDDKQRVAMEGFKAGTYAKIVLDQVPAEFVANFDARTPLIVGGLTPTEDRYGFVQIKIKRHRWHKKILKTNDPLIISLGWRRFQTLPIYSTSDNRTRNRMLKYTPEHMHCFGAFYGPFVAPNTGFAAFQSLSAKVPGFRIAATGMVMSVDENVETVKKLKLTGTPYKIFKNTAFIKDMFTSSLEIAKFEGASIKTVSGIRGQIKKALAKPDGHFRATFEDRILMSDIVFLRAWYPIKPHRFYNPVTNLLGGAGDTGTGGWREMRLTGQVRHEAGVQVPDNKNSHYTAVERVERRFNPLRVPRQLAADLPYKSQITRPRPGQASGYLVKRAVVLGGEAKRARDLLQKVNTLRKDKTERRAAKKEEHRTAFRKRMAENESKKGERERREQKAYWKTEGRKRKGGGGEADGAAVDGGRGKRRKAG